MGAYRSVTGSVASGGGSVEPGSFVRSAAFMSNAYRLTLQTRIRLSTPGASTLERLSREATSQNRLYGPISLRPILSHTPAEGISRPLCATRAALMPWSSHGCSKEGGHLLPRRYPPQALSRSIIHKRINALQMCFANVCERRPLRMQPADKTIGILVGPSFPRVIRMREEHVHVCLVGQLLMPGKLFAVIQRQTQPRWLRYSAKHPAYGPCDFRGFLRHRTINQRETRASFHQCYQVARLVRPADQITFPVPNSGSGLDLRGSRVDHSLIRDLSSPSAIVAGAPAAAFAMCSRKVPPEIPASFGVSVDVFVDRLFAYPGTPLKPSSTTDHLGGPAVTETDLRVRFDLFGEPSWPWPPHPLLRHPMRLPRLVAIPTRVSCNLSADCTRAAPQSPRDLSLPIPGLTPHTNQPTLCNGHASVSHCVLHVFLAHEERNLPRDHFHA